MKLDVPTALTQRTDAPLAVTQTEQDREVIDFTAAGLGLDHGMVRLVRSDPGWEAIGQTLARDLIDVLAGNAIAVEHIGSTAVPGLLAKPILDLAIGLPPRTTVADIAEQMSKLGWIYDGDAGDDGGWVFVLEDAPSHRVAHAHGVEFGGDQWIRYLQLRDLLRHSDVARDAYEETKKQLATRFPDDRQRYTVGKDLTVRRLLSIGDLSRSE